MQTSQTHMLPKKARSLVPDKPTLPSQCNVPFRGLK
jgi:hypothetical protein